VGFDAIETRLQRDKWQGTFCFGEKLSLADVCLVAQIYNADRFEFDRSAYPLLAKINEHCLHQPYFQQAKPL